MIGTRFLGRYFWHKDSYKKLHPTTRLGWILIQRESWLWAFERYENDEQSFEIHIAKDAGNGKLAD